MKRCLALLIAFALLVSLIGCEASAQKNIEATAMPTNDPIVSADTASPAIADAASSEQQKIDTIIQSIKELLVSDDGSCSVAYNSISGVYEVVCPVAFLNYIFTKNLSGDAQSVSNWNYIKEKIIMIENDTVKSLNDMGYSTSISLSFSDSDSLDIPLLTAQNGQIIYEATNAPEVTASFNEGSATPEPLMIFSDGPDGAVALIDIFTQGMSSISETYTVRYNETTGIIEVFDVLDSIVLQLEKENASAKDLGVSIEVISSTRDAIVYNCNLLDSYLKENGYSIPVSLSFSDSKDPDKILLTAYKGEVVYDIAK